MKPIEIPLDSSEVALLKRVARGNQAILEELSWVTLKENQWDPVYRLWDFEWETLKNKIKTKLEAKGTRDKESLMHLLSLLSTKL